MLTLERTIDNPAATVPPPAAAPRLHPRDRRLIEALVQGAATQDAAAPSAPDIVPLIPWLVPGLAVLTSAAILLIWAAVF